MSASLGDTLADLRNVARIFDIEPQAQPQMAKLQASIDQLATQMQGNTQQPRVFVFDSGEKIPTTVGGFGMPQAMIDAARAKGFSPEDDNEADAIAILLWAFDARGGAA